MKLRTKFILTIGTVLLVSFGFTFYKVAEFQNRLVASYAEAQARILAQQILLTRKWVSDHNGLFFLQSPTAMPNPFLESPSITDESGRVLVKRNPAMVTRELAEYSDKYFSFHFRVTSLKPVNPKNSPDEFEKESLLLLENGVPEIVKVLDGKDGRLLRFIMPLTVEDSCLTCHEKHGYKVGDIRGALSMSIPMAWAEEAVAANNRLLFIVALVSILLVGLIIYLLMDFAIIRRLSSLSIAMDRYPSETPELSELSGGHDEIADISKNFVRLGRRLLKSQDDLEKSTLQIFQSEKLASLGRLAAGVAHEINNPLGGMRNCVKSMKASPDDEVLRKRYLDLLDSGLVRVEKTTRQLLDLGRSRPLRPQKVRISVIVKDCFELIQYRMKNIYFDFSGELTKPYFVDADALRQVIVNIGLNAVQEMPEGGTLKVRLYENPNNIFISIADSGRGIDEENMKKIFDPFFTTKDVGEGSGIGLSVSYSLVQEMGGCIVVESKKDKGACFIVQLPKNDGTCPPDSEYVEPPKQTENIQGG